MTADAPSLTTRGVVKRRRFDVRGTVQGVGFRPFVHRLANECGLFGWVCNSRQGVVIDVEGAASRLDEFHERLLLEKPALSRVLSCESSVLDPRGYRGFEIRKSDESGRIGALILPDVATCSECLTDVFDPGNRRYLYPFTNCTHCGPRFTIIESLPYDRPNTSMKHFAMCTECRREYADPANRRFHAQPNACPRCGPHIELWDRSGEVLASGHDSLLLAARAIREGRIAAVKGVGGFHLMVDALNENAVTALRSRKHRDEKPLAVMVPSLGDVEDHCRVSPLEARLLRSLEAPIVLLLRRTGHNRRPVASSVAPGNPYLGVMLPYTPLHHILMRELAVPVVATSGNLSDEPIYTDEQEALRRLRRIADVFLVHNRPIVRHVDDSVVRVFADRELMLRRARGYAPLPIALAESVPPVLAVGAHQKNTVALAVGDQVVISQHIGDLATPRAHAAFKQAAADMKRLFDVAPLIVASDRHPDYLSTRYTRSRSERVVRVQHHHAHVVSCMVENELEGRVLGVAFDGTGWGPDGTIWGGEFLRCTREEYVRVARLKPFRLPGGERAAAEPRRCALGLLYRVFGDAVLDHGAFPPVKAFKESELRILVDMLARSFNCPETSSAGRLFDAVAAIVGIRQQVRYEGQAAMELEFAAAEARTTDSYPVDIVDSASSPTPGGSARTSCNDRARWVVNWEPMIKAILNDLMHHVARGDIAGRFHNMLVESIVDVARLVGESRIVLSGGCFQNRLLLEGAVRRLEEEGFRPYWHRRVPPNDGGIALGQAVVAHYRRRGGAACV